MTLDERVEAQRAIESVDYMHPIGAVVDSPDSTPANGTMDVNDAATETRLGSFQNFDFLLTCTGFLLICTGFPSYKGPRPPVDDGSIF